MLKEKLKHFFGYEDFRPLQEEIISDVLQRKDVFVLMPTGGGKSICYQLPALMNDGLTLVISPLISLMKDQVDALRQNGVAAAFLNSSLSLEQQQKIEMKVRRGELSLLYVAPERFSNQYFLEMLGEVKVSLIAIDEAHCISEWGHDFRPDYRQLSDVRDYFPRVPIIALTATATKRVLKDILLQLEMEEAGVYQASFNRHNLFYEVQQKVDGFEQVVEFLNLHPGESGIVYCFSRKRVEQVTERLAEKGFKVLPYHAGLSDKERQKNQEAFIRDDVDIVVATVAFGMGIDKPDVRFVIHHDLPSNLEKYYQETGRAGRDGLDSTCLLLFDYSDKAKIDYFINQRTSETEKKVARQQLKTMLNFAESYGCRREALLGYFGEEVAETNCGKCDNCTGVKRDTFDATVLAQKIISCVCRLDQRFGVTHVAAVLTGSKGKKVLDNGHTTLSTYGLIEDMSAKDVGGYIRELIQLDYLRLSEGDYPVVKLTAKSAEVLKGEAEVFLRKKVSEKKKSEKRKERSRQKRGKKKFAGVEFDRDLFETLRSLRKDLADKQDVPPYVVFSDASLIEFCIYYPNDRQNFLRMKGVGETKLERYGEVFMSAIDQHCENNSILREMVPVKRGEG